MSYLVVVSFDLDNAVSEDYLCIRDELDNLGLHDNIVGESGDRSDLPTTTFAGKLEGSSASSMRDDICHKVEGAFGRCRVKGKFFVSVGGNWTWGIRHP